MISIKPMEISAIAETWVDAASRDFKGGTERVQPSWFYADKGIGCEVEKQKHFYHLAESNSIPENERLLYLQRMVVRKLVRQAKVVEEHWVPTLWRAMTTLNKDTPFATLSHPWEWALTLPTKNGCQEIGETGEGCWRALSTLGVPWQP